MAMLEVAGMYRVSGGLRTVVNCWSDWSDEGLWCLAKAVKAAVLMNVLETAWFNRAYRPWRGRVTNTDEFIAWVENWLAK